MSVDIEPARARADVRRDVIDVLLQPHRTEGPITATSLPLGLMEPEPVAVGSAAMPPITFDDVERRAVRLIEWAHEEITYIQTHDVGSFSESDRAGRDYYADEDLYQLLPALRRDSTHLFLACGRGPLRTSTRQLVREAGDAVQGYYLLWRQLREAHMQPYHVQLPTTVSVVVESTEPAPVPSLDESADIDQVIDLTAAERFEEADEADEADEAEPAEPLVVEALDSVLLSIPQQVGRSDPDHLLGDLWLDDDAPVDNGRADGPAPAMVVDDPAEPPTVPAAPPRRSLARHAAPTPPAEAPSVAVETVAVEPIRVGPPDDGAAQASSDARRRRAAPRKADALSLRLAELTSQAASVAVRMPTRYQLPAQAVERGMSTRDAGDVVADPVRRAGWVRIELSGGGSSDSEDDQVRIVHLRPDALVDMADFADTATRGANHPLAQSVQAAPRHKAAASA